MRNNDSPLYLYDCLLPFIGEACLNLFRVGAFLNCGLNLFHDLIVAGIKEFANNCNLVNGFLNSVWLRKFNSYAIHYILECCLYNEAREELKLRLVFLNELKIEVLLFGDDTLTEMQNLQIFKLTTIVHASAIVKYNIQHYNKFFEK
jgi:hypothetical protein